MTATAGSSCRTFGAGKYNDSVGAILFDHLDADAEREVIVMGVYIHGIGPESGKPYHLNTALDWDGWARSSRPRSSARPSRRKE